MPTPNDKAVFRRDVISALLFVAAADGVYELAGFIARKQLDAPAIWIGILGSAAYWGYVWNLFFGYLTARLSLRRGLLVLMLLASVIAALGAWVDHPVLFCWVVAAFLPFGSTSPMSSVFNTAIAILFKVMLFMHGMVVLIIAGILRFIGFDGTFDLEDETFEPPPPLVEKAGEVVANEPINEMIAGSMFWIMVCVAAVFAIIVFLRDRGYVFDWETAAGLWRGFRRWFLAMLRGVAAEVDDIRIAIQNVLRVEPRVAAAETSRWRFIRVNALAPRDQVRYFYFSALRHAARRWIGRLDHQTPLEFAGDLAAHWPDARPDSDALTTAFLTARYTRETIDETEAGVARALWKRLRSALKHKAAS